MSPLSVSLVVPCVAVSVNLWVLLWVSECVLTGTLKFPCILYHYCWLSRRIYYILHFHWHCVSCHKKMLSVVCSKHLSVLVVARIGPSLKVYAALRRLSPISTPARGFFPFSLFIYTCFCLYFYVYIFCFSSMLTNSYCTKTKVIKGLI